jgi:hypothetical protein
VAAIALTTAPTTRAAAWRCVCRGDDEAGHRAWTRDHGQVRGLDLNDAGIGTFGHEQLGRWRVTWSTVPTSAQDGMSAQAPAEVMDTWVLHSDHGPVQHLRTFCVQGHVFTSIGPMPSRV